MVDKTPSGNTGGNTGENNGGNIQAEIPEKIMVATQVGIPGTT